MAALRVVESPMDQAALRAQISKHFEEPAPHHRISPFNISGDPTLDETGVRYSLDSIVSKEEDSLLLDNLDCVAWALPFYLEEAHLNRRPRRWCDVQRQDVEDMMGVVEEEDKSTLSTPLLVKRLKPNGYDELQRRS